MTSFDNNQSGSLNNYLSNKNRHRRLQYILSLRSGNKNTEKYIIHSSYIIALFKKGYTKGLEYDDVYDVLNTCRSNELGNRLEQEWQKEKTKHKKPLLFRPLLFCFGKTFITLGVIQLVVKLIIT